MCWRPTSNVFALTDRRPWLYWPGPPVHTQKSSRSLACTCCVYVWDGRGVRGQSVGGMEWNDCIGAGSHTRAESRRPISLGEARGLVDPRQGIRPTDRSIDRLPDSATGPHAPMATHPIESTNVWGLQRGRCIDWGAAAGSRRRRVRHRLPSNGAFARTGAAWAGRACWHDDGGRPRPPICDGGRFRLLRTRRTTDTSTKAMRWVDRFSLGGFGSITWIDRGGGRASGWMVVHHDIAQPQHIIGYY